MGNRLLGKVRMYKWPIILIFIVVSIDFYVITKYFFMLNSVDDQMKLISPLVTFNSILIAAAGIMYQVKATNEREIQFRVHQQRKDTYEELIKLMEKMFKLTKAGSTDFSSIEDDYRSVRPKMIIYASPQVVAAYTAIQTASSHSGQKNDSMLAVKRMIQLYSQIRSEVGFTDKDVPTRRVLSLILTDIDDPKYDSIFDKNGYLLPVKDQF